MGIPLYYPSSISFTSTIGPQNTRGNAIIIQRRAIIIAWSVCVTSIACLPVAASALGALSQSFTTTDSSLVAGTVVDLKSGTANSVEKAASTRAPQLLGVAASDPLVALGSGTQQAQIVVSGLTPTLVSDINGSIKVGDKITASPIQGIGMKAGTSTEIVGTAESNLTDSSTTTQQVTDKDGKATSVKIGVIEVQVNVSYYNMQPSKLNNIVPSFLVNVGSSIAGKNVSPIRILIAFAALVVGFLVAGILLQAGVHSGIISMGRNPLAGGILRRSLLDVLVTSIGLLALTVIVFYLVLTT